MLVFPSVDKVVRGQRGMLAGIQACISEQCLVSAVSLIYAAVDALAALTRPLDAVRASRVHFKEWVTRYMVPHLSMTLTANDIYAARCAVLHTYGVESDASRSGDAKVIVYKWRHGHKPDDERLTELARNATVIEVESLYESLESAVAAFEASIAQDSTLEARVTRHVADLLCYAPWSPIHIWVAA